MHQICSARTKQNGYLFSSSKGRHLKKLDGLLAVFVDNYCRVIKPKALMATMSFLPNGREQWMEKHCLKLLYVLCALSPLARFPSFVHCPAWYARVTKAGQPRANRIPRSVLPL